MILWVIVFPRPCLALVVGPDVNPAPASSSTHAFCVLLTLSRSTVILVWHQYLSMAHLVFWQQYQSMMYLWYWHISSSGCRGDSLENLCLYLPMNWFFNIRSAKWCWLLRTDVTLTDVHVIDYVGTNEGVGPFLAPLIQTRKSQEVAASGVFVDLLLQ